MPFKNPHPLYNVYHSMKERCRNKKSKQWKDYGGRGISICQQWLVPKLGFKQFLLDMGDRPNGFTLDRIDNNKGYSPENCRWASRKEQQRNRNITKKVIIEGIEYIASDLADLTGMKTDTIVNRAKLGLTYQEIINTSKRVYKEGLALGGKASGLKKQQLTHCKNGHEFTLENTYISKQGWRTCRKCRHKA